MLWEYLVPALIPAPGLALRPDTAHSPYKPAPDRDDLRCQFLVWGQTHSHCLHRWMSPIQSSCSPGRANFRSAAGPTLFFLRPPLLSCHKILQPGLRPCPRRPWNRKPSYVSLMGPPIGHTTPAPALRYISILTYATIAICSS